jgi:hypothetical protein
VHVDPLAVGIVVLAVATALIHLLLGISLGPPSLRPFPLLFYLNMLGYLVLVTALYTPQLHPVRRVVRRVFIAYTVLTIVLWFLLAPAHIPLGYLDKVIEVVLVTLLIADDRRDSRRSRRGAGARRTM